MPSQARDGVGSLRAEPGPVTAVPRLDAPATPSFSATQPHAEVDALPLPAPRPQARKLLLDLALVTATLVLLIATAVTAAGRISRERSLDRLLSDIAAIGAGLQSHSLASAPASTSAPAIPGFDGSALTPVGGRYRWERASRPDKTGAVRPVMRVGIVFFAPDTPPQFSSEDWLKVDRRIDDGDVATGSFRTGFNGWPVFTVPVRP